MRTQQTRLCIYPKDVQRITGKSERYGRMLLQKIRHYFSKEDHQFVTVEDFCTYTGVKKEDVISFLAV